MPETESAPVAPVAQAPLPAYLADLNEVQRIAAEAVDGPVLVLAGAGTGKTRVLIARLSHILATRRAWPMSFSSRRRISAAALLVKVTATICDGQARRVARMWLSG